MSQDVSCSVFRSHALVKRHQSTPKFCSTTKVAPHTCATLEVEPLSPSGNGPTSGSGLAPSILSSIALDITYVDLRRLGIPQCIAPELAAAMAKSLYFKVGTFTSSQIISAHCEVRACSHRSNRYLSVRFSVGLVCLTCSELFLILMLKV